MSFSFDIVARDPKSRARRGQLNTPHGSIQTPNFIFCGTKASIKGVAGHRLRELGTDIILSNTYHLMLQPGPELVKAQGGLHKFMRWDGPMLTDSGGFQVFSMAGLGGIADEIKGRNMSAERKKTLLKITEEGAAFRSYITGEKIMLTPERSIQIQRDLGADLIVQFDELAPFHVDKAYTARAMRLSSRWGDRCLAEFKRTDDGRQKLYAVVQGGVHRDLRIESAQYTAGADFFGTAIGGSLGQNKDELNEIVSWTTPHIHPDRPVHLLGIGSIRDVFANVRNGIDTFDCVSPTRIARHGWALMKRGPNERFNMRNARFRNDSTALDESNPCDASRNYSRAYIHHLFKAGELLGMQLLAEHNICMMNRLMRDVRAALETGTLDELQKEWLID